MTLSPEAVTVPPGRPRRRIALASTAVAALLGGLLVAGVGHDRARDRQLQQDLQAERERTYPRPPLAAVEIPGDAVATYRQAEAIAADMDLHAAAGPEGRPWQWSKSPATWADAPAPLRALAAGDAAAEASALLARGASQPFGRARKSLDLDLSADGLPHIRLLEVSKARALELAATGRADEAAANLLAQIRYGQDFGRGSVLIGLMVGAAHVRAATGLLPEILAESDLSAAELHDLLRAYERLLPSQPSFAESFRVETLWMARQYPKHVDRAAAARAYRALVDTADRGTAVQTAAFVAAWADEVGASLVTYVERHDRNVGQLHATYIALALLAYQRDHGAYPATLDALVPAVIAAIPDDPISALPFHYEPLADGGILLRSRDAGTFPPVELRLP